eukprot:m.113716 g.113716  ORF g.113716 m.113716 type:complete len:740 (+) comp15451_c0_seq1:155-2374(+)
MAANVAAPVEPAANPLIRTSDPSIPSELLAQVAAPGDDRLQKLQRRMQLNGTHSQGYSQEGFEGDVRSRSSLPLQLTEGQNQSVDLSQRLSSQETALNTGLKEPFTTNEDGAARQPSTMAMQELTTGPPNPANINKRRGSESDVQSSLSSDSRPPRKQAKPSRKNPAPDGRPPRRSTRKVNSNSNSNSASLDGDDFPAGKRTQAPAPPSGRASTSLSSGALAAKRKGSPVATGRKRGGKAPAAPLKLSYAEMEARLVDAESERDRFRGLAQSKDTELLTSRKQTMQTLCDLVSAQAQEDNQAARDTYLRNVQRLGWASSIRSGMHVHDVWNDGAAFRSLRIRQKEIELRRKALEEEKKDLAKVRPVKTKKRSEDVEGFAKPPTVRGAKDQRQRLSETEYGIRIEIIQLNLASLKQEDEALKTQRGLLLRERNLHLREMKRITDEDNAKYKDLPHRLTERYVLCCLLGRGGFSEVYKAYDLLEQRYVACKVHQLNTSWSEAKKQNYIKHATREYEIHRTLKHESVVELHDVFEIDANSFCTVLEYCPGQDLDFLLKQEQKLGEKDARNKVMQIIQALKYLNTVTPPVIHYDLKPANVLLRHGHVKITDFGLSKQVQDSDAEGNVDLTSQGAGTYWYLPPECFVVGPNSPKISSKVDVWSVGVIFYQSLYGEKPFGHNQTQQSLLQNNVILNAREVVFPDKPKVSPEAKAFIRRCLTYDARFRPDVNALAADPYLKIKSRS